MLEAFGAGGAQDASVGGALASYSSMSSISIGGVWLSDDDDDE